MVKPEVRRQNDILVTQKLWAAISVTRQQKQIPNLERITRYLEREYSMKESDIVHSLQLASDDQLIIQYNAVGCKGARIGVEQEGYRIPSSAGLEKGDHDWYCFDCHQPGEVVLCNECWRVYHTSCTEEEWQGPTFVCAVCKSCKDNESTSISRKDLSKLLEYTVRRLKEKTHELHSLMPRNELEQLSYDFLIFHPLDLNALEERCAQRHYTSLEHFYVDCRTILHNTFISYGDVGKMADLARIMIRDCTYDLEEIRQCRDCYYYSNARPRDWFCQPCRNPHRLVFAKQQGFSYWPAKVIKVTQAGYDVRFFGAHHQRAIIAENNIRPIDTSLKALNVKKTGGFSKAVDEMNRHQKLLERSPLSTADNLPTDDENDEVPATVKKTPKAAPRRSSVESTGTASSSAVAMATGSKKRKLSSVTNDDESERDATPRPRKKQRNAERQSNNSRSTGLLPDDATASDDHNVVTSSVDQSAAVAAPYRRGRPPSTARADSATQTSKKLLHGSSKQLNKTVQTEGDASKWASAASGSSSSSNGSCNCEEKYNKFFGEFKDRLETSHKDNMEQALRLQENRLRKEFEEELSQASASQASNVQLEVERARALVEERVRESHAEHLRSLHDAHAEEVKVAEKKHKAEVSAAKKKQWCSNCEEEAMYHCCWNTSYCSLKCQQDHWHREHKRLCRRKRP